MADQHPQHESTELSLPVIEEPFDPANQSLSDALRASFRVLKLVMAVVVVLYLCSGFFMVDEKEEVVLLRFGENVGLKRPGLHFGLPYPIDERIRVPTAPKTKLIEAFWLRLSDEDRSKPLEQLSARTNGLNPAMDGALLTGDKALMHMQYKVTYKIHDSERFVQNVSDEEKLLRTVLQNAGVAMAARTTADVIWKRPAQLVVLIKDHAQRSLDALHSGITIENISADKSHYPLQAKEEFLGVSQAEMRMRELIQDANKQWEETLKGKAGLGWEELYREITRLTQLSDDQQAESDAIRQRIRTLLTEKATGEAGKKIQQARSLRDRILADTKAEANTYTALLDEYRRSPDLIRQRELQNMLKRLFTRPDVVNWVLPSGKKVVYLSPDPEQTREAELQRIKDRTDRKRREEEAKKKK